MVDGSGGLSIDRASEGRRAVAAMIPVVRHCAVCGQRVAANNRTFNEQRAYCQAHLDLAGLESLPPDPVESLPVMSADFADSFYEYPLPPSGEAVQAREGTEG
jgi:hypothetical protein